MISQQSFENWTESPLQGATPKPFTQTQTSPLIDELQTALTFIQSAHESAKNSKLADFYPEAYTDICDAIHHCQSAIDYLKEIEELIND